MSSKLPEEIELPLYSATVAGAGVAPLASGAALLEGWSILNAVALFPATIVGFALIGAWVGLVLYVLVEYGGM